MPVRLTYLNPRPKKHFPKLKMRFVRSNPKPKFFQGVSFTKKGRITEGSRGYKKKKNVSTKMKVKKMRKITSIVRGLLPTRRGSSLSGFQSHNFPMVPVGARGFHRAEFPVKGTHTIVHKKKRKVVGRKKKMTKAMKKRTYAYHHKIGKRVRPVMIHKGNNIFKVSPRSKYFPSWQTLMNPRRKIKTHKIKRNPRNQGGVFNMFKIDKKVIGTSVVGGLSFIGSLMIPKMIGWTDWKKYIIPGALIVLGPMARRFIGPVNATTIAVGAGIGLAVSLVNDLFLKKSGNPILADGLSDNLDLISAPGNETFDIVSEGGGSPADEIPITD